MNYGIGYQGSKNKIAQRIIDVLPSAMHFYDLFCGGGALSHCALMSGKWKNIHFSDKDTVALCVKDFLDGNLPDGSEWISREDFYARKDAEPWVRVLWSWSGNCKDYIYSREIEPYKKAVHEMIYAPTPNERRLKFKEVCRLMYQLYYTDNQQNTPPESRPAIRKELPESLTRVQHMERLYPPNLRIFSELQTMERQQRISRTSRNTTDAGRLSQCVPFYVGSMTAVSVTTEM